MLVSLCSDYSMGVPLALEVLSVMLTLTGHVLQSLQKLCYGAWHHASCVSRFFSLFWVDLG